MTTSYRDWQPGHLALSAPALQVLRYGPDHDSSTILGLALRELVGMGLLTPAILQSGEGTATVRTVAFRMAQRAPADLERALQSVMDGFAGATAHAGQVTVQSLARALRDQHDGELSQWVEDDVLQVLIDRKLYEKEETTRLGVIPTTRIEPTAEGRANQALVEEAITYVGNNWDDWASKDTQRARTFLKLAGSGVLVVPDIHESVMRFVASQQEDAPAPSTAGGTADAPRFSIARLALHADELRVLDDVLAYTYLDVDKDDDTSTRT
jgi:hypothetical protein